MKKLILVLCSVMIAVGAMAQNFGSQKSETTAPENIAASEILYWVGSGSNQAILTFIWVDDNDSLYSYAWGYKWNGSALVVDMLKDIDSADSRVTATYGYGGGYLEDFEYVDGDLHLMNSGMNWIYTVDAESAQGIASQSITNGNVVKFCDYSAAPEFEMPAIEAIPVTDPNASATPEDATIDTSAIVYWVGEGSNRAILSVNWAHPDSALAWGYKFDGDSVIVKDMMDAIDSADYRFTYTMNGAYLNDITFESENGVWAKDTNQFWSYNVNCTAAALMFNAQKVGNGALVKWGDPASASAVVTDSSEYNGAFYPSQIVWTKEIVAVPAPKPQDATIDASEIKFWIGEGENKAILAVNWGNPDIALAWGYKFTGDSVIVKDMMDDIDSADSRLSYVIAGSMLSDINFISEGDTFGIATGQYWMYNVNGKQAGLMFDIQKIGNGDLVKWGDPSAESAIVTDSSEWDGVYYPDQIVWTKEIAAVSAIGPFSGAVGTEGCEAISCENENIVAWAVSCEIVRGPQQIGENEAEVTYGSAADAMGPVSMTDNLSVVSLGDGGSATLTFANSIKNGEGPDFAIYENSFNDTFLELAFVEVSSDGEHFVRFKATSLTQTETQVDGMGNTEPTMINNLAGKYRAGWGTPFDLEELRGSENLDIDHITHVRIVDVIGSINPEEGTKDAFGHMINDPFPTNGYSGGFDLDGVAVLHMNSSENIEDVEVVEMSVYPNPTSGSLVCKTNSEESIEAIVYDMSGRIVKKVIINGSIVLDLSDLSNGVYMLRAGNQTSKIVVRK